jgi:hypothetical protein
MKRTCFSPHLSFPFFFETKENKRKKEGKNEEGRENYTPNKPGPPGSSAVEQGVLRGWGSFVTLHIFSASQERRPMNPEVLVTKRRDAFFGKRGENFGTKSKGRMTHK